MFVPGTGLDLGVDGGREETRARAQTAQIVHPGATSAGARRRESRAMAAVAAGCAFAGIATSVASGVVGPDGRLALGILALSGASYFALFAVLVSRGVVDDVPRLRWLNAAIEGVAGTLVLLLVARVEGPGSALTWPGLLLYPVFLGATAVHMRPGLSALAGAIAVVGFLIVYYSMLAPGADGVPTLGEWGAWNRAFGIAGCAGVAAVLAHQLRELGHEADREGGRRRTLERELGRMVSHDVASAILRGEAPVERAERRDVTVLFCDLRDFTTLCERRRPEEVVDLLNSLYERACAIVAAHGGAVNKFLGDGLLALFDSGVDRTRAAWAAAGAAHEIMYAADELRRRGGIWASLDIGISLDGGDVVVGGIGASSRAEVTAIGTTVNRAARLQGVSREAERRIVLSEGFAARLGRRANLVGLGSVKLKGLERSETAYAFRYS